MTRVETVLWLLDELNCGGLVLDDRGSLLAHNASAQRFLDKHVAPGRHKGADARHGTAGALRRLFGKGFPDPARITIADAPRASDARPLVAYRLPYGVSVGHTACALIVLVDVDERPRSSLSALRHIFGLTAAEARLAARLAAGESLRQIAAEQAVSIATARAQLKCVLAKTRTHRQAELVALVNRLAPLP